MIELYVGLALSLAVANEENRQDTILPTVTVFGRRPESLADLPNAVTVIRPGQDEPLAIHPNQLLDKVSNVWISQGSGQEHLTAIRSPVLTGAGACGAFLYLEDGVPIRPAGFCNVNNLFELNMEQADTLEVVRGPGSALYGGNALHGSINVVNARSDRAVGEFGMVVGSDDFRRADFRVGQAGWRIDATLTSAGSFRNEAGYDQQKLNLRHESNIGSIDVTHSLAATNLNQETAGFIFGLNAYRDPGLRRANLNPEAFRDAYAVRVASHLQGQRGDWSWRATPLLRSSRMDFLQHFLPGQPLEENGQDSVGLLLSAHRPGLLSWTWGLDFDAADGFLRETQAAAITTGSAFLRATRPAGKHYDYQVDALSAAAFAEVRYEVAPSWDLTAGLRAEWLRYDYDNRMLSGQTRDDGMPCGFGGCLFNRPADRRDRFSDIAPKLTLRKQWSEGSSAHLRVARGFRPPQTSELYRLQRQQNVADLDSETLDSAELGYRWLTDTATLGVNAFYMSKDHFIFRDAAGLNVSDGRTRHRGVEFELSARLNEQWQVETDASYAQHNYAFSRAAGGGEVIVSGNEVDTAPRRLARIALRHRLPRHQAWLEWVHQGDYFLDAANEHRYQGHDLWHLNGRFEFSSVWQAEWRLSNLTGRRYADRADYAFGDYRYFPGQGRAITVAIRYRSE